MLEGVSWDTQHSQTCWMCVWGCVSSPRLRQNTPPTHTVAPHLDVKECVEWHIVPECLLDVCCQLLLVLQLDCAPLLLEGLVLSIWLQLGQLIGVSDPAVECVVCVCVGGGGRRGEGVGGENALCTLPSKSTLMVPCRKLVATLLVAV